MRSAFYLLDVAPYGSEKAYGLLNASAVSIEMEVTLGLYADGVYLALAGQDGQALAAPTMSDTIYAYPEIRVLAHEPSLARRGLLCESLIERVELVDDADFLQRIRAAECLIIL
ncbi:MAG: DsrE/DsrF-like family protein [Methanosaeta sp. PtaB.Bin039]|nr:MAG: DsrE/DsrF-like family protein [Methanosaeta sp. PtaB.Bin039]OPY44415.1 MAG: DsrE/DsrF-like family protein [Methanosaeta sp. PtaU1.Bin028]HOT06272.1 DsrE family protein [Methanotrichaceae archaeon]HQF15713.1 DsrE family protein [Methanotrichaceae archaeon]HQI90614.1 DsrE family protein [Methanotrichaceae archaeon]